MRNDSAPRPGGRSSPGSPLRLTEFERKQTSRRLAEKGWTPQRVLTVMVDLIYGCAKHTDRYRIYPPTPREKPPRRDTYLLSDRLRETGVFVESSTLPTPHQAAEILRDHGIPSLEMTSEQARSGEPRVVLPEKDKS